MLSSRAQAITGIALSAVEGVAGVGTALLTGGTLSAAGIGATVHSVSTISSILAKQKDLQNIPDTVRHMGNNLSFDMADDNIYLRFLTYQISPQIKKIIADYFAMYGYKCLEVKKPNLRTRYYYNYIKTVGCNIDGDFDNKDIAQIKAVYDKGITIWHNRAGVTPLKYDFDNVEMSLI
jgi:hypothetical protein